MNIASDVKTYLEAQITGLGTMYIDTFGTVETATMIKSDPSSATDTVFVDGSTTGRQVLSFYARGKDQAAAYAKLDTIMGKLDGPKIALTGVLCIQVTPETLPSLVSKDDAGVSIYSCTVVVEYDGKNPKEV